MTDIALGQDNELNLFLQPEFCDHESLIYMGDEEDEGIGTCV